MLCICCVNERAVPSYMNEDGELFYRCVHCHSEFTNPLKEESMAKKEPTKPKPTVWESKSVVCQCCRSHSNKPSKCTVYDKSVGRKQDATDCEKFKRKS